MLEERLQRRLREWQKLARRYRIAQDECDVDTEEWWLNKENVEMIERLSAELASDLAATNTRLATFERPPIAVAPVDDSVPF